jgi:hypothetical protein
MLSENLENKIRFNFQSVKRFCEVTGLKMHLVRRALARQELDSAVLQEIVDKSHAADPHVAYSAFLALREEIIDNGQAVLSTTQFIEIFNVLLNHTKIIDPRDPRSANWIDPVNVEPTILEPDPRTEQESDYL